MTAKEIAAKLNISPSAVSLALNGRKGVSEETRAQVLALAQEYGLRKPRQRNTPEGTIALVVFRRYHWICNDNTFFTAIIESIGTACREENYALQIIYFLDDEDWDDQLHAIEACGCSGVILLATEMLEYEGVRFEKLRLPLVVLDNSFDSTSFHSVTINNTQGAGLAVRHVLEMGHRSIGFLWNNTGIRNFEERHLGAYQAIDTFNRSSADTPASVIPVSAVFVGGSDVYPTMTDYLDTKPQLPTVFVADNDTIAIPCIQALQDRGYRVPEDISVIGFDNAAMSNLVNMQLTTIDVPKHFLGRAATQLLVSVIRNEVENTPMRICANTTLIRRNTVGHAAGSAAQKKGNA